MSTAIIIGAGHNGLITACYLAKNGYDVTVYEQAPVTGGLCINRQIWPGYTTSVWANWYGMLCPEIIEDLNLDLHPILGDKSGLSLTRSGGYISTREVALSNMSEDDRAVIARHSDEFTAITKILRTYFLHPGPTRQAFLQDLASLNLSFPPEDMMASSLLSLARRYSTNPNVQLLLCLDSFLHPSHEGTGYSRAFMGIPFAHAEDTEWCYLKGGMGRVTEELHARAIALGVTIHTSAPVARINHAEDNIQSITLQSGETIKANIYACGTDYATFLRLMQLPPVKTNAHAYTSATLHLKLKQLPTFTTVQANNLPYPATINLLPPFPEIESSTPEAICNPTFASHIISVSVPTLLDPSRAPAGKHTMMLGIEHTPLAYSAEGWTDADRNNFFQQICTEVAAFAPDFHACIEDWRLFTPADLKSAHGLDSMQCFHGDLAWGYAMDARLPGLGAGPQTGYANMYLCGAAIHPGGTVNGAPGYRAAHAILAS